MIHPNGRSRRFAGWKGLVWRRFLAADSEEFMRDDEWI
jgi:hypothetical protein